MAPAPGPMRAAAATGCRSGRAQGRRRAAARKTQSRTPGIVTLSMLEGRRGSRSDVGFLLRRSSGGTRTSEMRPCSPEHVEEGETVRNGVLSVRRAQSVISWHALGDDGDEGERRRQRADSAR